MSYEINIIVVNQKKAVQIREKMSIILQNEQDNEEVNRYFEIWPFFSNMPGVLYTLVKQVNEELFSSFPICDANFEADLNGLELPYWVKDTNIKENLVPFIIKDEFLSDFEKVLLFLIESSPIKTVLFQTRYQCDTDEIICGVISFSNFLSMLLNGQILFNVCYIVNGIV